MLYFSFSTIHSYRTFPMHRAFLHREFNSDYLRYSRTWPQIRSVSILRQALPSQSRNSEHDDMKRRNLLVGTVNSAVPSFSGLVRLSWERLRHCQRNKWHAVKSQQGSSFHTRENACMVFGKS